MSEDEKYMRRCLQLAACGRTHAAPNPMVGAVIVHEGRIIGEGYHRRCGGPHAEVNAIASVKQPELLSESTIYVSLEPCSHYGKTPPCADLIISKRIPRVVVGCVDPFAKVAGRGIEKLRAAGIEVKVGVLEEECLRLNRRFITFHQHQRPYVVLKWAVSANGYLDATRTSGKPAILSTPLTQMLVHRQRSLCKAILVGRRTALLDNPSLTVRAWDGEAPLRLVIDRELTLPDTLSLFDGSTPTWIFTERERESRPNLTYVQLDFTVEVLPQIMRKLYEANIQSLLVEGGASLLQSFLHADLWDELFVEHSAVVLPEGGVLAPEIPQGVHPVVEQHFGVFMEHVVR
jgi:diaminohydroxyphosphoribosylaminopyrimidine deaminase/5-amino-6-(5-phosphoribosylamino)uracil reductase